MAEPIWSPVVYGRTRHVDRWWRAIPADTTGAGASPGSSWLAGPLHAVVQGGRDLTTAPRFLLARRDSRHLVGVACRAADLDPERCSDGVRDLYCFVGWAGTGEVPTLTRLQSCYREWAGAEYRRWVGADWGTSEAADPAPHRTPGGAPPWPDPDTRDAEPDTDPPGNAPPAPEAPGRLVVWPEPDAGLLWHTVAAGVGDAVLVTGLQRINRNRLRDATHVASADAAERHLLGPAPDLDARPAPIESPTAPTPGRRSVIRAGWDLLRRPR